MTDALARPGATLPKAYSAFAPVLERLSAPMLQVLNGQLEQFERLVRDLNPPRPATLGEFEGLGGLTQRGDLSHVVQSELLLRTEAPLEFLRRLAESETVYLEKQYAAPGARTVYRAMISAGPGLLGHGRIVALAALFFMARLAAALGGEFHWCFLPRAEGAVWFDEVSVNSVKRLLRTASYREMSLADAEEAADLWTRLAADSRPKGGPDPVDWIIGARPWRPVAGSLSRSGAAVELAANTLSFSLSRPVTGQLRAAELRLRQGGRERVRTVVDFPEDMVCAGALRDPFRPPAPAPRAAGLPAVRREPPGWAPQYFVTPAGDMKVIRTDAGLLILSVDNKQTVQTRWFAALPPDLQLVGLRPNHGGLSIAVHGRSAGTEVLWYGHFRFESGAGRVVLDRTFATRVAAEHLFRRQPAYALPPLTVGGSIKFHSTSGNPFQLEPTETGDALSFAPLYKSANILHSDGRHDVVRINYRDEALLRVIRASGERVADYHGGVDEEGSTALREIVYTHADRTLAYSRAPNSWALAPLGPTRPESPPSPITLRPYETLLTASVQSKGLVLRLWSDARYGGSGEVRTVRVVDGEMVKSNQVIKLGDDALNVAKVAYSADGAIWALTVDGSGAPAELLAYRRRKNTGRVICTRFDLEEQIGLAIPIDLGQLDV